MRFFPLDDLFHLSKGLQCRSMHDAMTIRLTKQCQRPLHRECLLTLRGAAIGGLT